MNICVPNLDNDNFFHKTVFSLPNSDTHQLISGGNFNCCFDPTIDHSSPRQIPISKAAKVIKSFIDQFVLSDHWRCVLTLQLRNFNFFHLSTIPDETWETILQRVHSSSIGTKHSVIQCKIVHRAQWTRVRLACIYPEIDTCVRCRGNPYPCVLVLPCITFILTLYI